MLCVAQTVFFVYNVGMTRCEDCIFYTYDDEYGDSACSVELDEDEYEGIAFYKRDCPYFRDGDDYKLVRHQN